MSFRAVTWAFDRVKGLTATQKLVLLALAEFANDQDETWRSREAIAERAECSVSSVNQTIRVLRDKGLVAVSGRYTWCDETSQDCEGREPHKHRSGSTYRLNLDVTAAVDNSKKSTLAKSASVEKSPVSRGKVHICKSCKCGPTLANGSTPHLQGAASVLSINPQLNLQTNQPEQEVGVGRLVAASSDLEEAAVPDGTAA